MSRWRGGSARGLGLAEATRYGRLAPVRSPYAGGYSGTRLSFGGRRTLRARLLAKDSPLRHVDWVLVCAVLALCAIGTALVWSATAPVLREAGASPYGYLEKQLLNVVIGVVLMVVVSVVDYRLLRVYAPVVYVLTCLGLLAVLSPLGATVNGAHSWIALPAGFQVEPSEFAKIGLILMTAMILGELRDRVPRPGLRQTGLALALGAVPILLVILQPDLGVTVLMLVLLLGMVALSGVPLRWLAGIGLAGGAGIAMIFGLHLLQPYQEQRLASFFHPSSNPLGSGYSAAQAKIAIGSGGLFGQGLFHGQLVAGNFVPEQQTDFIFSVAGEELGFVGAIAIIILLGIVLLRALRIASRADDLFGLLVAAGIAIWFGVQSFINIGMTIGIAPVTGLPLPFVSYGGSALFADMIAMGMLLAIHRRHQVFR